ncbi:MAG: EutN/CcmL family microcompartment protein [Pseudomonadota bacterium]
MELARVVGNVVASTKTPGLEGVKFMLIEPLDHEMNVVGSPFVACDAVENDINAGEGDLVFWVAGREAAVALPISYVPVDATIVGIADRIDL